MSDSATLWTVAHQEPLSMWFPRQEFWNGLPSSPPEDHPIPGIKPTSLIFPMLAGRFFATRATWEAPPLGLVSLLDYLNRTQETSLLTRPVVSNLLAPRTNFVEDRSSTNLAGREGVWDDSRILYLLCTLFPISHCCWFDRKSQPTSPEIGDTCLRLPVYYKGY